MKPFAGLGAQMALIDQCLNQGRNLAIALDLWSQVSEHRRLDIQASKVMNFQRPDCSQAEAHAIAESIVDFFCAGQALIEQIPHFPLNCHLNAVDEKARQLFAQPERLLANVFHQGHGRSCRLLMGAWCWNDLHERYQVRGIKPVRH